MTTDGNPAKDDPKAPDLSKTVTSSGAVSAEDMMALKGVHEAEVSKLNDQVKQLTADVTSEQAAKAAVEAKLEGTTTQLASLDEYKKSAESLTKQLEDSNKTNTDLKTANLKARRETLSQLHGLKAEQVDNLDESQLSALETVLPTVAKPTLSSAAHLDIAGAGSGSTNGPVSAREKIAQGIKSDS